MNRVLSNTFGGLSKSYYLRQLFFSLLMLSMAAYLENMSKNPHARDFLFYSYLVVSTFLYPYSRFVYESITGFIMGENVFFVNAILMLIVKAITMLLCWGYSIIIAPVGLIYLYFRNK